MGGTRRALLGAHTAVLARSARLGVGVTVGTADGRSQAGRVSDEWMLVITVDPLDAWAHCKNRPLNRASTDGKAVQG